MYDIGKAYEAHLGSFVRIESVLTIYFGTLEMALIRFLSIIDNWLLISSTHD